MKFISLQHKTPRTTTTATGEEDPDVLYVVIRHACVHHEKLGDLDVLKMASCSKTLRLVPDDRGEVRVLRRREMSLIGTFVTHQVHIFLIHATVHGGYTQNHSHDSQAFWQISEQMAMCMTSQAFWQISEQMAMCMTTRQPLTPSTTQRSLSLLADKGCCVSTVARAVAS